MSLNKNIEFINTGSTRLIFLIGNYAIKIPRFVKNDDLFFGRTVSILKGWQANRVEYKWSKSKIFDFLCPVKFSCFFSFIIIIERAKPLPIEQFYKLKKFNFGYEHKLNSYGLLNGKVVIVDYGN